MSVLTPSLRRGTAHSYPRSYFPLWFNSDVDHAAVKGLSMGHSVSRDTVEIRMCDGDVAGDPRAVWDVDWCLEGQS